MFPSIKNKFTVRCMNVIIIDGGKCFTVENDMRLWVVSPNILFDLDLKSYSINLTNTCIPKREDWRPLWSYVQGNHNTCKLIFFSNLSYFYDQVFDRARPTPFPGCVHTFQRTLSRVLMDSLKDKNPSKEPILFLSFYFLQIRKITFYNFKLVSLRTDEYLRKKEFYLGY